MIQLTYTTNPEAGTLTLIADEATRQELRELRDTSPDWGCCTMESEVCEHLIANSELQWVNPSDTEDLTDAPLLGILGEEQREKSGPYGVTLCGGDEKGPIYHPIVERWGYEPYQVRSFLDDLLEHGKAVFQNAW